MKGSVRVKGEHHAFSSWQSPHSFAVLSIPLWERSCIPERSLPVSWCCLCFHFLHSPSLLFTAEKEAPTLKEQCFPFLFPTRYVSDCVCVQTGIYSLSFLSTSATKTNTVPPLTMQSRLDIKHRRKSCESMAICSLTNVCPRLLLLWAGHGKSSIFVKVWNVFCY